LDRTGRDALLVVRAQLGDRGALAELVGHWHEPVWRYARRMLNGARSADDVSQDAWARVLRSLPRLREPERFAPWLFTIVRRSVVDHWAADQPVAPPADEHGAVPDGADVVLDRVQVVEGLGSLPAPEREVLVLFHLADLSLQECAQVLGVPAGTVKSRLHRARGLLRDRFAEKGYVTERGHAP
jgi:RNA polymerase sigma-70 factor (ECF subfamily)